MYLLKLTLGVVNFFLYEGKYTMTGWSWDHTFTHILNKSKLDIF